MNTSNVMLEEQIAMFAIHHSHAPESFEGGESEWITVIIDEATRFCTVHENTDWAVTDWYLACDAWQFDAEEEEEVLDLFEHHEQQPPELAAITQKYSQRFAEDDGSYPLCEAFLKEVEAIGYTFEYYLQGEPFNLVKK